jgi:head-tail adaptor
MTELAGTLRERVTIETWVAARDDSGADVGQWQRGPRIAAAVLPDGGGGFEGEARRSRRRWQVVMRAGPAIDLAARLRWRGGVLAVLAVVADPSRPDRLIVRAEERP